MQQSISGNGRLSIPHNGPLSGMIITAAAAVVTFPLVYFNDTVRARFDRAIGDDITSLFMLGAIVMALHKLESLLTHEYEHCPVYLTQAHQWGSDPARAIFVTFVPTFLGMLMIVALALFGPPWHLAIVTVWLAHGLHELHHVAKSISRRRIYPGLVSSILFVAVQSGLLFPQWYALVVGERGALFDAYYLALPLVVLAYYVEDRRWIARTPHGAFELRVTSRGATSPWSGGRPGMEDADVSRRLGRRGAEGRVS
jgi:hypothetical protein